MLNFLKKKWLKYLLAIVTIVGVGGYFYLNQGEKVEYVIADAVKGEIVQTVSVTGSIKADPTINMHFQKSGKVNAIFVKEGEKVVKDQVLASLENRVLELEIKRNKANIWYAGAQYNQAKAGTKSEEIKIAEADVLSSQAAYDAVVTDQKNTKSINESNIDLAELALDQAEDNVVAADRDLETTKELAENEIAKLELGGDNAQTIVLDNAYSKARINLDSVTTSMQKSIFLAEDIIGIRGTAFFLLSLNDIKTLKNSYYVPANDVYQDALVLYTGLTVDSEQLEVDEALNAAIIAANSVSVLLAQVGSQLQDLPYSRDDLEALILDVTAQSSSLSNSVLALSDVQSSILNIKTSAGQDTETLILNYQLQIDAAENAYNNAVNAKERAEFDLEQSKLNAETSDRNAEAQVAIRDAALTSSEAMLALKKSPVREVDLAPYLAQISLANVALEVAENEYADSQLKAPINGVVTFIEGKVGTNISLSETALSSFLTLQADSLMVEANVPETDISKVNPGDKIEMTVDAFDFTEKFTGTVAYVDVAETVIQGVVYYQIKATFDLDDDRLKSGMTTNLDITTDKKDNVLIIPARAIKYEDSIRYVEVLRNGDPEKVTITTGLESDQDVEVLTGLNEGDKIITFVK